jgi:D-3-phosphoglycerate dehydrogenase / 2-oxoglutarate reductase
MKYRILANDGIDPIGKKLLEKAGFEVDTNKIPQEELVSKLNAYDAVTVRSATKIRKDLIDACPNLKVIGRGGVGMDNIDVEYAKSKGLGVYNTPAASSLSVAELVFSHLFSGVRFLHLSNRAMPTEGVSNFSGLKKNYADGIELRGKSIGIIGFGRIGREVAKIAIGLGMKVYATDIFDFNPEVELQFADGQTLKYKVEKVDKYTLIQAVDFISIHIPAGPDGKAAIGAAEIGKMKKGVGIVNCARGGVIDENALLDALNNKHIAFAGLDVFENEPTPDHRLLTHPNISLSPHIGAATNEAQERIGVELAELIIAHFKG